jgi:hypothetical protein
MHKWGIPDNLIVARFICPACKQEVGLAIDQLEKMVESNDFTFWCPSKSVFAQLYPPQVREAYEKILFPEPK